MSAVSSNPSIALSGFSAALSVKAEKHSEFTQERWLRGNDGARSFDYADRVSLSSDEYFEAGATASMGTLSLQAPRTSFPQQAQRPKVQPRSLPPPPSRPHHEDTSICSKDAPEDSGVSMEDLRAYLIERIFGISMGKRLDASELSKAPEHADEVRQALQDVYTPPNAQPSNQWLDAGIRRTEKVSESVEVEATLQAQVSDGKGNTVTQSVNVKIRVEQEITHTEEARVQIGKPKDPLVIDLTGTGFSLTGIENGTVFDLNGDGHAEKSATVAAGTGLLWLDRNANGKLDNGTELFGDAYGAQNGFDALSKLDENHDGQVNALDSRFKDIRIHLADGHDLTLDQARVASLQVAHLNAEAALGQNQLDALGLYQRTDGSLGALGEVRFGREAG